MGGLLFLRETNMFGLSVRITMSPVLVGCIKFKDASISFFLFTFINLFCFKVFTAFKISFLFSKKIWPTAGPNEILALTSPFLVAH